MAMESVLKQLETRIEELVDAYRTNLERAAELESRVADVENERDELKARIDERTDAGQRIAELEKQRDGLADRLEKVLGIVDSALGADATED